MAFDESHWLGKTLSEAVSLYEGPKSPIEKLVSFVKVVEAGGGLGYSVYELTEVSPNNGVFIEDAYTLTEFINKRPEYRDAVIHLANDFFGTTVLRVKRMDDK